MPNHRRVYIPGGTYFLTLVTHYRLPLKHQGSNVWQRRFWEHAIKEEKDL